MFYICEFEFYNDGESSVAALCLNGWGGATFGGDLEDAGESAADWLTCMVDDCLMNGRELPPVELGHEPQRDGHRARRVPRAVEHPSHDGGGCRARAWREHRPHHAARECRAA